MTIFEGVTNCSVCNRNLGEEKKYFGMDLDGYTHGFCERCFKNKNQIKEILHRNKSK